MSEASILKDIRKHCIECMGTSQNSGYRKLIETCSSRKCNLWPHRFGETRSEAVRKGRDVKR